MKRRNNKTKTTNKLILFLFIVLISVGVFMTLKIGLFPVRFSDLHSKNFYVYNITDDKVEFHLNEKEKVPPASLTKIMTTIVALEHIDDLGRIAPIDVESYKEMVNRGSSMAGFYGKESTTYRDLLYGTILASGGEAAESLAVNVSGEKSVFINLMNEKATELGLENTNFKNANGLDEENHYSSAEDIGKILNYALKNGHFRAIFTKPEYLSTKTLDHPDGKLIRSTVLSRVSEFDIESFKIIGGKSGTTINAGYCWATLCEKKEKEYIVVVMGYDYFEDTADGHIFDTIEIMKEI